MESSNSCKVYRVSTLSSSCALMIVLVVVSTMIFLDGGDRGGGGDGGGRGRGRGPFNFSKLEPAFSVSIVELQAKFTSSGHDHPSINTTKTTVIRRTVKVSSEEKTEQELALARALIHKAATSHPNISLLARDHQGLAESVYHNLPAFYQSYMEMEKRFKVYVYSEGDLPMVHNGPCKSIYASEGRFIEEIEHGANRFRTSNAQRAHVYFMPFSVTMMVKFLYETATADQKPLRRFVADYLNVVSAKYPFWNRTQGADHFMLACHDWGPYVTRANPLLYNTSIRVLCNANTSEGFDPRKDISLPEIKLYGGVVNPKLLHPPPDNVSRPLLGFFAGRLHGPVRPILLNHWKGRDPHLRIYGYLPKNLDYYTFMLQSKFCLCPSGYEVASPRIVEAIYAECVPVILSSGYVLPFSDVLRWEAFSVQVNISEIPRLKALLMSISEEKYKRLKEGVRAVRRHFTLNQPAKRFDMFHLILHSVWLRRLNLRR